MPVNAIAMPFSFAAAIDSSSLIDPPRLETGVRLAIYDSLSLATVVLSIDLGASVLESQNREPDPGFGFLGVWNILGVVAVLIPKLPRLKEWAYAGFYFAMSVAAISHIVSCDCVKQILPSMLLLILTVVSWYLRPENRKIMSKVVGGEG